MKFEAVKSEIEANVLSDVRLYETLLKIKNGDFSVRFPVDKTGIAGKFWDTFNEIVELNEQLVNEFSKAGKIIGKEGKLSQRVELQGGKGSWNTCVSSVNSLITDLTHPTMQIADVISAIGKGNLSKEMPLHVDGHKLKGEFLRIAKEVNSMVKQLNLFTMEVTRVALEVGTEGKLGGQAKVKGVGGTWKDLTDSVNKMASNLTAQVRNIADVTTAVAKGDLSKKITVDVKGEILELKNTINTMVDQLNAFGSEVTRVAREVGTEGKLGVQANVPGVDGTWEDLTDSVNQMASNLTSQMRNIAEVTTAVAKGDLSKKITVDVKGEIKELKETINTMVDQLNSFGSEVTRVALEVGSEGKLGGQANVPGVGGSWKDLTDSVNLMANNLTSQVRNIADVTTAVAKGDLSKKITVDVKGEIRELKLTINTMVDQLNAFGSEVTRVAREVGTEGKLGGQANVPGVDGTWKDLTDSVNQMASNLTGQMRNIANVTTAVANGDLSKKITVEAQGEIMELKDTINTMVDRLNSFGSEVTRVAREVGTEGKLGVQANVPGVDGSWKDLTDSVNQMASNLTGQMRNIAEVTTAVAKGDLSKKITIEAQGEIMELKETINTMVDQLNAFGSEVTRVALEVGSEGKLGGQANVPGVDGSWKDLTDSVNKMASNLTGQVRNIAEVTTAVAQGDLSKKITVDVKGEIRELKETINTMVDQLNSFASEVTRVSLEVGTEGKLGGQANVPGVDGTWKDLTDSVNKMASNLTGQVRNIAEVTTAVANGDLSRKITVDVKGEIRELKITINTMVDQLRAFASEVTRVAREVGTDGKLGGQANVPGVAGTWKDLTDSVNQMASNLTGQVRNIAEVANAVANGDMSRKITADVRGEILQLKETLNTMVDQLRAFASEVTRVAREVGTDGKLGGQAYVPGVAGIWKDLTDSVNQMTGNLTSQVRNIAEVTKAVASGDLSKTVAIDVKGEILDLKNTINTMVEQLNSFAFEVTRVAREVGTEGILGGQAEVKGVGGTWKDLTDSVNMMATNLTSQVRGIAKVVTGVAKGNLTQKLSIDAKGEVAQLTETINEMIDTLAVFADQVTTVAREVGAEGRLGGQANVPGTSGIWKNLTENVNQLADNLTTQVRSIADVASAVTKGDLTRTINVEAKGEVEALKDTINQMIANLKETTLRNQEQDWLKSNLAKFNQMLQGQKDLNTLSNLILSELASVVSGQHGVFYILDQNADVLQPRLKLIGTYGARKNQGFEYCQIGEGLIGQCALEKEKILMDNVPQDYIKISSGLGEATPLSLIILPILFEDQIKGVLELASFQKFSQMHLYFLEQLTESIGIVLNNIASSTRTEMLLEQSQSLAVELKTQQEELRRTNEELEDKAHLLVTQKEELEQKNYEVEIARKSLEEKAAQLMITSKYKSEFLANMSHELRTPLNSLLILSQQLSENHEGNLSERQIRFSKTINSCGNDLVNLINDILDLSKIESGVISVDNAPLSFEDISRFVELTFRHMADHKKIKFDIEQDEKLPEFIETDEQRLKQILKNLLSNSFKFTEKGKVKLRIFVADKRKRFDNLVLDKADMVIGFEIKDTGIGISKEKQHIIFEAFQQAEGSTSRKFGGTGLGLSISRGLTSLLGGTMELDSELEKGSTFTLYLPLTYSLKALPQSTDGEMKKSSSKKEESKNKLAKALLESGESIIPYNASEIHQSLEVEDHRAEIKVKDKVVMIVMDSPSLIEEVKTKAVEKGYKTVISTKGGMVFDLINQYHPNAIVLDVNLSDIDGWKVLNRLKNDLNTRSIPVSLTSVSKDDRNFAYRLGAYTVLAEGAKSESVEELFDKIAAFDKKKTRSLLVIEDSEEEFNQIRQLLEGDDVKISQAVNGEQAVRLIKKKKYDCIILDLRLPDFSGLELLALLEADTKQAETPLIVFSTEDLSKEELTNLKKTARSIILKSTNSIEKLLDFSSFYLHRDFASLPDEKREIIKNLHPSTNMMVGKKVLLVDDDVRNIFALVSALEGYGPEILSAESGRRAIEILEENDDIDIVLMDIMMPEMDGFETIQLIRKDLKNKNIPIIAVTAKAMKGDREKCLEAGASDYITKPLDMGQLISIMRIWLNEY
ncbi:HAMP domain-containing protein [Nafulsella turpanensis]|uniref:HAMP domain-containing protein n=1 Tax=Nafulsella turpanensis TaxID=1265690 RepID=UPI000348C0C0|nr:HAMP domain-containing protein [Nafulsella turpanensis]